MAHLSHKSFLKIFFTLIVGGMGSCWIFLFLIDPYAISGMPEFLGWNNPRTAFGSTSLRATKIFRSYIVQPKAIVIGSSRALTGISTEHKCWEPYAPAYNMAVAGTTVSEQATYLKFAIDKFKINVAVIGLDFFMFNARANKGAGPFSSSELSRLYVNSYFSSDAIRDGIRTVLSSNMPFSPELALSGQQMISPSYILSKPGGYQAAFHATEIDYLASVWWGGGKKGFDFTQGNTNVFDIFREQVRHAYETGTEIKFFISPQHVRLIAALHITKLWPYFQYWKQEINKINEHEARKARRAPFPIWDFAYANTYTKEALRFDGTEMVYYLESSHFTEKLGDLVLDRILCSTKKGTADFGVLLASNNINTHLKETELSLLAWEKSHVQEVNELNKAFIDTAYYRTGMIANTFKLP